ncbi:MAG TPA: GYF domain-containing protein [Polyangiaceae bacterium]|nr:GYF domain-containing protein [Polyangiaceae bacterium]
MSDADSVDLAWGATAQVEPAGVSAPLWQVNTRGRKVVEMSLDELVRTYKSGKLTARSLVWSEGMPEWAPIGEVSKLMRMLRPDSEPPASGARLIGDETEPPVAATKSYTSTGSEPPTDPGTLAIYERPLATIEFPDAIEPAPESVDEPTPAFGGPAPSIRATLPGIAPEDLVPLSAAEVETAPPPLPPLPARPQAAFPPPVTASPLGAALSSTVSHGSQPFSAPKPPSAPVPGASYAVAKATSVPSTAALKLPAAARLAGSATETPRAVGSNPIATPLPATPPKPASPAAGSKPSTPLPTPSNFKPPAPAPKASAATTTAKPFSPAPTAKTEGVAPNTDVSTPTPVGADQKLPHDAVPAPPPMPAAKAPLASAPRPAIEFLPPIIVQEKEDDGASIIRMPLEPPTQVPLDAQFHESTLVLAGRRRPKRWVPLGAAVAAVVGAACLASAVTALMVRTRPEAPRVVEKRVVVTVPATTAAATVAAATPAPAATTPSSAPTERATLASERAAGKSEPSKGESAPAKSWRKDDPGALEATQSGASHRELRAGFPTNPGF